MKHLFCLTLAIILIFSQTKLEADKLPTKDNSPNIISVGLRLASIDDIDVTKGSYKLSLYLGLTCQKACPTFNFTFFHGESNKIASKMNIVSPNQTVYHLQLLVDKDFNSIRYPFDGYWLLISFLDQSYDKSKVIFMVDKEHTIVAPGAILHGWEYNNVKEAYVDEFSAPFVNTSYSRYNFKILVTRPILMGFLKIIFPAVIILLFAFITFVISTKHSIQRLGIVSGTLISSILLHLNISNSLPLLNYLTYVDSFMIINYFIFFIILFENVFVMRLIDEDKEKMAIKFDRICLPTIPILWLVLEISCILFFIYKYPMQ